MRIRRVIFWILILFMSLPLGNALAAQDISVDLNGEKLIFNASPILEGGRVLVPLRNIFDSMGAAVDWNGASNAVTVSKGDDILKLIVGEKAAFKNDIPLELDVPAKTINGKVFVPIRFVSEALGGIVNWREENKSISILSDDFISERTEDLIQKLETALIKGIDDAHQLIGNEFHNWRPLLGLNSGIEGQIDSFVIYNIWFPEGEAKQFVVRVINRAISGDRKIYSSAWLESDSTPVEDLLVYIDLAQDSFSIKWTGYLTKNQENINTHFDDNKLDEQLKVILGREWGYLRMFGNKPNFIKELKGYDNNPIGGFSSLEVSYPELRN